MSTNETNEIKVWVKCPKCGCKDIVVRQRYSSVFRSVEEAVKDDNHVELHLKDDLCDAIYDAELLDEAWLCPRCLTVLDKDDFSPVAGKEGSDE